jgi:tRNA-2-methylthio-N6-dimethylallyladenosine synthase
MSQRYRSKLCETIPLPVQSGNSEVLSRMNRGYTREEYFAKVEMIRQAIPGVVLSTDIILGFPGETHAQFLDTISLIEAMRYDYIYAFKYSPRPFTKAAKFADQVPEEEKQARLAAVLQQHRRISFELSPAYVGQTLQVLVEAKTQTDGILQGRSTQNKLVHFPADPSLIGRTVPIQIHTSFPTNLRGEVVSA